MDEPARELIKAWCPKCGFWRNTLGDIGKQCRRVSCDATVGRLVYRLDEDAEQQYARLAMELTTAMSGLLLLRHARTGVGAREIARDTLNQIKTMREALGVLEEVEE